MINHKAQMAWECVGFVSFKLKSLLHKRIISCSAILRQGTVYPGIIQRLVPHTIHLI